MSSLHRPAAGLLFVAMSWLLLPGIGAEEPLPGGELIATESGLQYLDLQAGDGPEAQRGDNVRVHYTGWLEDGTIFDSSRRKGQPFAFPLGRGKVIRGWDEGVVGMQIGGKRKLVIPPQLGYGKRGAGGVIPPNAILTFEIELLGIG